MGEESHLAGDYCSDGEKLGFGSFATVYLGAYYVRNGTNLYEGRHKHTKKVVAIKVVDIERVRYSVRMRNLARSLREIIRSSRSTCGPKLLS